MIHRTHSLAVTVALVACSIGCAAPHDARDVHPADAADVLIYGATPAGIAAAVEAARAGRSVLLIDRYSFVGGMITNGLTHTDFHTFEGITGAHLDFVRRVERYYIDKYGPDSPEAEACFRGTQAEPHVNLIVFKRTLAEHKSIRVMLRTTLTAVARVPDEGTESHRIVSADFIDAAGRAFTKRARVFIDATYEGDLMAMAGARYHVGREARNVYNEPLAPEKGDAHVQGYNFRLTMTDDPANRVPIPMPDGYNREDFVPLVELMETGKLKTVFCYPGGGFYKAQVPNMPRGKYDINDVSRSIVRLSLPQINNAWPEGDEATRKAIYGEQLRHNLGMLYFTQNDPAVPAKFRDEARQWGLCRDEFTDRGHLPEQLYVREGRRMIGWRVYTEHDVAAAPGDARAVLHADSIAVGEYEINCHGTTHEGPRIGGYHYGEFYKPCPPYQVPFGVLVSNEVSNLLVPVAASSSHVGFCALRLEPIWSALGQAAGVAAVVATERASTTPTKQIDVAAVQRVLHPRGSATVYTADVPPDHADFAAVQWWGTAGGLHGLNPAPPRPGQRGAKIAGQYHEAYLGHTADLDQPLDDTTRARWLTIADLLGIDRDSLSNAVTRGQFISTAFARAQSQYHGRR